MDNVQVQLTNSMISHMRAIYLVGSMISHMRAFYLVGSKNVTSGKYCKTGRLMQNREIENSPSHKIYHQSSSMSAN